MSEEELEEERIKKNEKLEAYDTCIETIASLLPKTCQCLSREYLEGLVEEIKYYIEELNDL